MTDREFWMAIRSALLLFIDAIEQKYMLPRTAEMRQIFKDYTPE